MQRTVYEPKAVGFLQLKGMERRKRKVRQRSRRLLAGLLIGALTVNGGFFAYAAEEEQKLEDISMEGLSEVTPEETGQVPTETIPEVPPDGAMQAPSQTSSEVSSETPVQAPTETPSEVPIEKPIQVPTETAPETSSEGTEQVPTETPSEVPAEDSQNIAEENKHVEDESELELTEKEMVVSLSAISDLGENQLRIAEGQEEFAKSLFSEEEIRKAGRGEVIIYADPVETFLNEDIDKGEAWNITEEEKSMIEQEQAAIMKWAENNGYTGVQYFVLRLKKTIEGEQAAEICKSREGLRMILELSNWLYGEREEPVLVYAGDGEPVICDDLDNTGMTITFDSSTFGTYALAYWSEEETEATPETEGDVPQAEEAPETEGDVPQTGKVPETEVVPETDGEQASAEEFMDGAQAEVQSKAEVEVKIPDENVTYQPGSRGIWNPATHTYENSAFGKWNCADNGQEVMLMNKGAADAALILLYLPASGFEQITGYFTDAGGNIIEELSLSAGSSVTVYLHLQGEPAGKMTDTTIGSVTYTLAEEV